MKIGLLVAAALAVPSVSSRAEDGKPGRALIAPPPGTRSDYHVKRTVRHAGKESSQEYDSIVVRGAGDAAGHAVFSTGHRDEFPVVLLLIEDQSLRTTPDGELAPLLFFEIKGQLAVGSTWTDELGQSRIETAPGRPAALRITSEREPTAWSPLSPVRAGKTRREALVDAKDGRVLEHRLLTAVEQRSGQEVDRQEIEESVVETAHRLLTADELAQLPAELSELRRAVKRIHELEDGESGSFLGWLLGKREKEPPDPLAILAAYEKAHAEGMLRFAVEPLREYGQGVLEEKKREEEQAKLAERLLQNPAPDFTLKDLEGKDASLKDFQGKAVVVSFWGFG